MNCHVPPEPPVKTKTGFPVVLVSASFLFWRIWITVTHFRTMDGEVREDTGSQQGLPFALCSSVPSCAGLTSAFNTEIHCSCQTGTMPPLQCLALASTVY